MKFYKSKFLKSISSDFTKISLEAKFRDKTNIIISTFCILI